MNKLATILLCVNFITVLFPQPGYIHPDEFFQSAEVVAGDVLNVTHYRAWEFEADFPLRSVAFPYMLTAPPLLFVRWLNETGWSGLHISTVKVVMSTRLPLAFLSVIGYLATGRLADVFQVDRYLSTILYCSSYVTWTYYTRTFSNTIESVLLAFLLLLTLPIPRSGTFVNKSNSGENSKQKDENTKTTSVKSQRKNEPTDESEHKEKVSVSLQNRQKYTSFINTITSFSVGLIVAAGIFNRPTFAVFAAVPVLLWLKQAESLPSFLKTCVQIASGAFLSSIIFVLVDTIYYNPQFLHHLQIFFAEVLSGNVSPGHARTDVSHLASMVVITPLNFVLYNTDSTNLAQHGLHPRILHLFINLPLLLGPLYIPIVLTTVMSAHQAVFRRGDHKSSSKKLRTVWLTLMAFVPTLALSVFPHQEPRFLIPALPVFIVMGARLVSDMAPGRVPFAALWVFFNILLTLVYGYIHQGAMIPAMSIYQQKLASVAAKPVKHTAIFYKTYPPPRHLLLLPESSPIARRVDILDLAGGPVASVQSAVEESRQQCSGTNCQTFVFLPATVTPYLEERLSSKFKLQTTSICPHFSTEAAPRFRAWWTGKIGRDEFLMEFCLNIMKIS